MSIVFFLWLNKQTAVCVCVFESLYMCFGENKEGVLAALWNF